MRGCWKVSDQSTSQKLTKQNFFFVRLLGEARIIFQHSLIMPLGKLWIHPLFHVLCLLDIYLVTDMSWWLMEKKVISNQLRKLSHNYPGRSCKWHLNRKGINYLILLFLFFFSWMSRNEQEYGILSGFAKFKPSFQCQCMCTLCGSSWCRKWD